MAHELLHGYALATLESARASGELERVAGEVEAFAAALTSSEPLRRALSDAAVAQNARRAIAADLLHGRASEAGASLVDFALRAVRAGELAVAVADLVVAADAAREGVAEQPIHGRSALRSRIRGYTERVLEELGSLDEVDTVEEQLFSFARIVEANAELRRELSEPSAAVAGRVALLADLLSSQVLPATLRIVSFVIAVGPVRNLVGTYEWLVDLIAEERGRRVAQVRAAVVLSEEERSSLARVLSTLVHRDVEVRMIEDPDVIGGILVSVGDLLIDGTVRLRLERLREAVAQWA
ncbi:MAG TPA: F0F1 ATP synthase subunit delta [Acidimicrobiales bacterium]|nr:F0F1 ATP synthase subunit delta [Acidimicrobiales bacterium]